jgi:hypothetical protein
MEIKVLDSLIILILKLDREEPAECLLLPMFTPGWLYETTLKRMNMASARRFKIKHIL